MQESSAAVRNPSQSVDRLHAGAYPRLVTKDTIVERDPKRTDAADDSTSVNGLEPATAAPRGYFEKRRARYLAAVSGAIPIAEYVHEAVAEVDRRQLPRAFSRQ